MKKLLVLMLVLVLASFANAALKISVNGVIDGPDEIYLQPSETVTIDMYNTGGGDRNFNAYLDFYYTSQGTYALSNGRLGPAAGDWPATFDIYDGGYDNDEVWVSQSWNPNTVTDPGGPEGAIFLIDLHCEGPGDVIIELWDEREGFGAPVDGLVIHQIPEPATIVLLGLGGLLLRRKK